MTGAPARRHVQCSQYPCGWHCARWSTVRRPPRQRTSTRLEAVSRRSADRELGHEHGALGEHPGQVALAPTRVQRGQVGPPLVGREVVEHPGVRDDRVRRRGAARGRACRRPHHRRAAGGRWPGPSPRPPAGARSGRSGPARCRPPASGPARRRGRRPASGRGRVARRWAARPPAAAGRRGSRTRGARATGHRRAAGVVVVLVAVEEQVEAGARADVEVGERADLGGDEAEGRQQQAAAADLVGLRATGRQQAGQLRTVAGAEAPQRGQRIGRRRRGRQVRVVGTRGRRRRGPAGAGSGCWRTSAPAGAGAAGRA